MKIIKRLFLSHLAKFILAECLYDNEVSALDLEQEKGGRGVWLDRVNACWHLSVIEPSVRDYIFKNVLWIGQYPNSSKGQRRSRYTKWYSGAHDVMIWYRNYNYALTEETPVENFKLLLLIGCSSWFLLCCHSLQNVTRR